jgi:FtsP/CotA-like multicopper oxidase with cupredoxin domain
VKFCRLFERSGEHGRGPWLPPKIVEMAFVFSLAEPFLGGWNDLILLRTQSSFGLSAPGGCPVCLRVRSNGNFLPRLTNFRLPTIFVCLVILACHGSAATRTQSQASPSTRIQEGCPRPPEASVLMQPPDLRSKNGQLKVALKMRSSLDANGHIRYCYIDEHGNYAPTLRVHPGDTLVIKLKNEISLVPAALPSNKTSSPFQTIKVHHRRHHPCAGGDMSAAATNLHFHGLSIPPVCHQDETLKTLVEPGDPAFEYRIQIANNQAPGLYWYHPHVHGFTEQQILGGASGALIVEGVERAVPRVAGLPERVFVIRDEQMPAPTAGEKADSTRPTKQLSINYIPVPYPEYPPAVIKMKPLERQFWRVVNASADTYLNLTVEFGGKRQSLGIVALDGVPVRYGDAGAKNYALQQTHVFLPPATRAEFIVVGPSAGVTGRLLTSYVYRGATDDDKPVVPRKNGQPALRVGQDDVDAARPLASILPTETSEPPFLEASSVNPEPPGVPSSAVRPIRKRTLYFSEKLVDPGDPNSATLFFITEEGHQPAVFDPHSSEPTITVHQGDVEDWTIENRSQESHTFHSHQLHFIVVGGRGIAWEEPTLRDNINLPAWDGLSKYPSATLRMDFRDPRIVGTFPFHCHILQHVDGGMMGTVRVEPVSRASKSD